MNKALPWNVNGVGFDARDAAREAAHRQGKSLGEWLHGVIADHAADLGVDADEMGGQQRINAVTSKLEHLSARGTTEHERRARHGRTSDVARRRAGWDREDDAESRDEGSREAMGRDPRDDAHPRRRREKPAPESTERLLEDAIEAMERRATRAEQRTDNALQSFTRLLERNEAERDRERDSVAVLAKKLTDMEARLTDKLAQDAGDDPIKGALARLESRLETLGAQADLAAAASATAKPEGLANRRPNAPARPAAPRPVAHQDVLPPTSAPAVRVARTPASGQKGRAPLTRLEAKLNSILGVPDAPADEFDGPAASFEEASRPILSMPAPAEAPPPAPWMVERFDAPAAPAFVPPAVPRSSLQRAKMSLASRLTPPRKVAVEAPPVAEDMAVAPPAAAPPPPLVAPAAAPPPAPSLAAEPPVSPAPLATPPATDGSAALAAILAGNRRLGPAIAEITRRQRVLDARVSPAPAKPLVPAPADLPSDAQARGESAHFAAMQSEIASLTGSIEHLRREVAGQRRSRSRATTEIQTLRAETEALADMVRDLAVRGALVGLETSIQALADSVAISRAKNPQSKVLTPVEAIVPKLRRAAGKLDAGAALSDLETSLRALATSIGGLSRATPDASAVSSLQAKIGELRTTIASVDRRPLIVEQMRTRVGALVARLERLRRHPNSKHDIGGDIEALRQSIGEPHPDAYPKAKAQIEDIQTVLADLRRRSDRGDIEPERAEFAALELVVRELNGKLDAVQVPGAGTDALDALQKQLAAMSDRFEQSHDGLEKLASLERSMRELFVHLEGTRSTVEEAAAHAAREVLRIAARDGRPQIGTVANKSLEVLQQLQDEAASRTSSTLSAVQGSLDDIVTRLSSMEVEIAEVRRRPAERRRDMADAKIQSSIEEAGEPIVAEKIKLGSPDDGAETVTPAGANPFKGGAKLLLEETKSSKDEHAPTAAIATTVLDQILGHRPGEAAKATIKPAMPEAKALKVEPDDDSRADFIAAARRAAKVAQADLADLKRPSQAKSPKAVRAGLIEQSRDYVTRHKRPVLLSMAALFVIAGAMTMIRLGATDEGESRTADAASASRPDLSGQRLVMADRGVGTRTAPATASSSDPKTAPGASAKIGADNGSKTAAAVAAKTDPMPTGSVTPLFAAAPPRWQPEAKIPPIIPAALQNKASAGDSTAQYTLGLRYADGTGVVRDFAQAAHWYRKAADQNLAPAQYRLASLYEKGLGVTQDKTQARALYLKAAEAGNPRAMHNLAVLLADGDGRPDYDGAATWFRKAAQYGVHDSQYNLGILLARGIGVKQSLIQSYQWFAIAAAQGDADAAKKRDEVGSKLRANDIAVATALATAFQPRTADAAATEVREPSGGWDSVQSASPVNSPRPKISAL